MAVPNCPTCGSTIKAWDEFCPGCGGAIPIFNNCSQCGSIIDSTARFCAHCGQAVASAVTPPTSSTPPPQDQSPPAYSQEDSQEKEINVPWYVEGCLPALIVLLLRRC